MSQGEILNCDLTSHTSADLDPYREVQLDLTPELKYSICRLRYVVLRIGRYLSNSNTSSSGVKFSWITLYSATDFHESAVTDFYERQDDCGRGQLFPPNSGDSGGGGSGKPNYAPNVAQQGIYVGGVIRRKYHGGWRTINRQFT